MGFTYNRLRRLTKRKLSEASNQDRSTFDRWLASHRAGKQSQQVDLPSSQIPPKMAHVKEKIPQLFVIIDTCSICSYRNQFIDYITRLKHLFSLDTCPIKFIISLVVLEELDKCNRPQKRSKSRQQKPNKDTEKLVGELLQSCLKVDSKIDKDLQDLINIGASSSASGTASEMGTSLNNHVPEPPRMFMRFLEEEMRMGEILISELDPFKKTPLSTDEQSFEIVNKDDRILECCLRSRAFVMAQPHHSDTNIILVSEDNVFKSKATTYGIASYRWLEFKAKYKNFGLHHYTATPMLQSNRSTYSFNLSSGWNSDLHHQPLISNSKRADIMECKKIPKSDSSTDQASENTGNDSVIFVKEVIIIK